MDKDDHATSCRHQADCLPFVLVHQCLSVLLKEASTLYLSHTLDIYCFEDLGMCILCIVYFAYILVCIYSYYLHMFIGDIFFVFALQNAYDETFTT